jgi:hypothetical protein
MTTPANLTVDQADQLEQQLLTLAQAFSSSAPILQQAAAGMAQLAALLAAAAGDPPVTNPPPVVVTPTPTTGVLFAGARWLNDPIPAGAALDPQSSQLAAELANGQHVDDSIAFGIGVYEVPSNSSSVKRATCKLSTSWGLTQIANVAYPSSNPGNVPSGSDHGYAIIDWDAGIVTNLWGAKWSASGWTAEAGTQLPITGDGIEKVDTSTGADLACAAGIVRLSELKAGKIAHALVFSSNMAAKSVKRYPANKTDGSDMTGVSPALPEGSRIRLDPTIDLTKISGITDLELAVGLALQEYGAFCCDNGGARIAIRFEEGNDGQADYYQMPHLPWSHLQVLAESVTQP